VRCAAVLVLCMSPDTHWSLGHTVDLLLGTQIIKKPGPQARLKSGKDRQLNSYGPTS